MWLELGLSLTKECSQLIVDLLSDGEAIDSCSIASVDKKWAQIWEVSVIQVSSSIIHIPPEFILIRVVKQLNPGTTLLDLWNSWSYLVDKRNFLSCLILIGQNWQYKKGMIDEWISEASRIIRSIRLLGAKCQYWARVLVLNHLLSLSCCNFWEIIKKWYKIYYLDITTWELEIG